MRRRASSGMRQLGLSIVELLVGVAIGLIVMTGAIKLMIDTFGSNRRLLVETRVNQDLRAAADLIARDIRRAGYWANSASGVFTTNGSTVTPNPYTGITVDASEVNRNSIAYAFARDTDNTVTFNERAGFRLTSAGVLEFRNDPDDATEHWLAVTDPKVITVTNLTITPVATPRVVELFGYCRCLTRLTCSISQFQQGSGTTPNYWSTRPLLTIRQYDIVVAGQSATDAAVQREIREAVRVRNDVLSGSCPNV